MRHLVRNFKLSYDSLAQRISTLVHVKACNYKMYQVMKMVRPSKSGHFNPKLPHFDAYLSNIRKGRDRTKHFWDQILPLIGCVILNYHMPLNAREFEWSNDKMSFLSKSIEIDVYDINKEAPSWFWHSKVVSNLPSNPKERSALCHQRLDTIHKKNVVFRNFTCTLEIVVGV